MVHMQVPFYRHSLAPENSKNVAKVLETPFLTSGPIGKEVEAQLSEYFGVKVLTDKFSANYLSRCVIDYSDELIGGGFKINNPNAESSCGCGKSFAT